MGDEALSDDRALAGQNREDALRDPRVKGQLPQADCRQGREFGRLEDDRVASRQRWPETPASNRHREVPRDDDRDNAERLLEGDIETTSDGDLPAEEPLGGGGVVAQHVDDIARLPARVADRVPGVDHFQASQLLRIHLDEIRELAQQAGSAGRRNGPPRCTDLDGTGDRFVGLLDSYEVKGGDDLFGRRVDHVMRGHWCGLPSRAGLLSLGVAGGQRRSKPRTRSQSVTAALNAAISVSAAWT